MSTSACNKRFVTILGQFFKLNAEGTSAEDQKVFLKCVLTLFSSIITGFIKHVNAGQGSKMFGPAQQTMTHDAGADVDAKNTQNFIKTNLNQLKNSNLVSLRW